MTPNDLRTEILNYFLSRVELLDDEKRFHFASRMWLWLEDPRAEAILNDMRPYMLLDGTPAAFEKTLNSILATNIKFGSDNALAYRAPAIDKHPNIPKIMPVLYHTTRAVTIYDIGFGWRSASSVIGEERIRETANNLFADRESVARFSTHAINFVYHLKELFPNDPSALDLPEIVSIADEYYDEKDPLQLQLKLYLLTHAIIGETLFYSRPVDPTKESAARIICAQIDDIITRRHDHINTDNKFEFLVCSRICNYTPRSEELILQEALESISPDGTFIIDAKNKNAQAKNVTFQRSEHRNVLFLMTGGDYRPHGRRL